MPRESSIDRSIIKAVKDAYPSAYVLKRSDRFRRAVLDIEIIFQRRIWSVCQVLLLPRGYVTTGTLFVETKKPKDGKLSALQAVEIKEVNDRHWDGFSAIVATDKETVLAKLEEMGAV